MYYRLSHLVFISVLCIVQLAAMRSNMQLVTHNMLTSDIIKGVKNDFPLGIVVSYVELKHITIYSYLACFHLQVVNIAFTCFYLIIARRSR